jgi:hypothetical protein
MDSNKRNRLLIVSGLLLSGLLLAALLALPTTARQWWGAERAEPAAPQASAYSYIGVVDLDQVVPGEFNDALSPALASPENSELPDLGQIDLGFRLVESGQTITGHVDLVYTLVFSGEHQLEGRWFGPAVQGSFDGSSLAFSSERLSHISAGRELARQFSLSGQLITSRRSRSRFIRSCTCPSWPRIETEAIHPLRSARRPGWRAVFLCAAPRKRHDIIQPRFDTAGDLRLL